MTATGCRSLEMLCDFGDGRGGALEALHGAHYGDGDPDNWAAMTSGVQRFEGFAMHGRDSGEAARAMHSMECRIRRLSTASASPRASAEMPKALQRRIACATHPTCSASNTRECSEKQVQPGSAGRESGQSLFGKNMAMFWEAQAAAASSRRTANYCVPVSIAGKDVVAAIHTVTPLSSNPDARGVPGLHFSCMSSRSPPFTTTITCHVQRVLEPTVSDPLSPRLKLPR
jgi:hypothetical protein